VRREPLITRIAAVDARCEPWKWRWASENRSRIDGHWRERTADKPKMFNGRVLLIHDLAVEDGACRATYFETNFADFLAWRDFGYPDPLITNGYAMGALRGSDGAYICGVMGGDTANAGRVYFPSGTPDPDDLLPDGRVDLAGSVMRELEEETSLRPGDYEAAGDWIVVHHWPAVAFFRVIRLSEPAEAAAERIRANIARQDEPELADMRVIRSADQIDPRTMPQSVQLFLRAAFEGGEPFRSPLG
jgi:8-oxo-dGTP pyrophosphatase MutT (NUDIX family)